MNYFKLFLLILSVFVSDGAVAMKMNYAKLADAEVAVWKGYYQQDPDVLLKRVGALLRLQYGIQHHEDANSLANDFFAVYYKFSTIPQNAKDNVYDSEVLPLTVKAYLNLREKTGLKFDLAQVAKADLAWWVARRRDETRDPELVAKRIESYYTALYEAKDKQELISRAAYLKAIAARYRDLCQDQWGKVNDEDWEIIELLLRESYINLGKAVATP